MFTHIETSVQDVEGIRCRGKEDFKGFKGNQLAF